MKLPCRVDGKPALIVGYSQGPDDKVHAVVIVEGQLKAVRLKEIELQNVPEGLERPKPKIVAS